MSDPPRDPDATARNRPEPGIDASAHVAARQLPDESRLRADPARLAEGWERRFVIEGARLADYVRLYESLGFEVIAEPPRPEAAKDECTDCRIIALLELRVIYTRAKSSNATRTSPAHPAEPDPSRSL